MSHNFTNRNDNLLEHLKREHLELPVSPNFGRFSEYLLAAVFFFFFSTKQEKFPAWAQMIVQLCALSQSPPGSNTEPEAQYYGICVSNINRKNGKATGSSGVT